MTTRYVNTASTAGGDGTTNATSGANRAYASLSEWEAAEQATLTDDHIVYCEGTSADTTACIIDGWTVGSYFITVAGNNTTAGKHAGVYSTSKYRLELSPSAGAGLIEQIEEKTVVRDIILYNTSTTTGYCIGRGAALGADVQALNLVCRGGDVGVGYQDVGNLRTKIKNCIVYDSTSYGIYIRQNSASTDDSYVINNTVSGCGTGIRGRTSGAFIQAWNNIAFGNTADWVDGTFDGTNSGYNAFGNSGASCPGSTDIDLSTYAGTDIFANYSGDDFHLTSGGSAYSLLDNDGVGPASNSEVPTDDIDGDARSGSTTSVGADVIVAGSDTAADSDGAATATGVGSSVATSTLSSAGASTATAEGSSVNESSGDVSSDGVSTAEATGQSAAGGDLSADGAASSTAESQSLAGTDLSSDGASTAEAEGAAVSEGQASASSDGVSSAEAAGASVGSGDAQSDGEAAATAGTNGTEEDDGHSHSSRWRRQFRKRQIKARREQRKERDQRDLSVIMAALRVYYRNGFPVDRP